MHCLCPYINKQLFAFHRGKASTSGTPSVNNKNCGANNQSDDEKKKKSVTWQRKKNGRKKGNINNCCIIKLIMIYQCNNYIC